MKAAILIDLTRCSGCQACVLACQEINGLPHGSDGAGLSSTKWTTIEKRGGLNVKRNCMHCLDPACVSVCPVAALQKTPEGPVIYDEGRCMGCRYCMVACPFNVPRYEWESALPRVRKCVMCFDTRIKQGKPPACTSVCPTGASQFGDRDTLIEEARARIATDPGRYVDHIYGVREAGGTSVLYLSSVPFEQIGFATDVQSDPYPRLTWQVLSKLPNVVAVGGALLAGVWWVARRKEAVARDAAQRGAAAEAGIGDQAEAVKEAQS